MALKYVQALWLISITILNLSSCRLNDNTIRGHMDDATSANPLGKTVTFEGVSAFIYNHGAYNVSSLSISPNRENIIYNHQGRIYIFNLNAMNSISRISPTSLSCIDGQFSSNSNSVLMRCMSGFYYQLYSVNIDGSSFKKISADFTQYATGQFYGVEGFKVSPDSSYVVYWEKGGDSLSYTRYKKVNIDGTDYVDLLAQGDWGVEVVGISPDSSYIIYTDDFPEDLYKINPDGTGNTLIRTTPGGNRVIKNSLYFSADSTKVFFAEKDTFGGGEFLFSMNSDGTGLVDITGAAMPNTVTLSPNKSKLVYISSDSVAEIYSMNVDGSGEIKLNTAIANPQRVTSFKISANSNKVVFIADLDTAGLNELYSINIDGSGGLTKLNGVLATDSDVVSFSISDDSQKVAFAVSNSNKYFINSISGGNLVTVNAPTPATGSAGDFNFNADASRIFFVADSMNIFTVPTVGGEVEKIIQYPVQMLYTELHDYYPANPNYVVLSTDSLGANTRYKLYSLNFANKSLLDITHPDAALWGVNNTFYLNTGVTISALDKIIYSAKTDSNTTVELFSVNLDGSNNQRLHPDLPAGRKVSSFKVSPDGERVVFSADIDISGKAKLYSVKPDGTGFTELSSFAHANPTLGKFLITLDSSKVIYESDDQADGEENLFVANIDGSGPNLKLTSTIQIYKFEMTPNGEYIVYIGDDDISGKNEIYYTNFDGLDRGKINDALDNTDDIYSFVISPNSNLVAYTGDQNNTSTRDLFVKNRNGSGGAVKINNGAFDFWPIGQYYFTENSSVIYFTSEENIADVYDLYSSPVTGGGATRLNNVLPGLHSFTNLSGATYGFSNGRIYFHMNESAIWIDELFSVLPDGTGKTTINAPLQGDSSITKYSVLKSRDQVIYLAEQDTYGVRELYSAKMDGSSKTKLNSLLPANSSVSSYEIKESSGKIVYQTIEGASDISHIYSINFDGSEHREATVPLKTGENTFSYKPLNTGVLYFSNQLDKDTIKLRYIEY